MSLMMMGGLNKNAIRSVYAIFDDKSADVELTWATDNATVVEIYTTFGGMIAGTLVAILVMNVWARSGWPNL